MQEFQVYMPGVEDVTDGSVDSFENDWVREEDQECPTSRCGSQSRCRCAGCGGCGRCSCGSSSSRMGSSRCGQSASRCSRSCANRCVQSCASSAEAVETAPVDWEEYEIVDE